MSRQELHPRTVVINKAQKNQSKKTRKDALTWLALKFPKAFDNTRSIHPLKIGIMHDVLSYAEEAEKEGISRSKLREALVLFTRRIDYLVCLKAGEMRIDLEGNPMVKVSKQEAEKAAAKIKKRVEKCLRNARKVADQKMDSKPNNHYGARAQSAKPSASQGNVYHSAMAHDFNAYDPLPRSAKFGQQAVNSSPVKPVQVIVTHKSTRQYDPQAVARLKEKLGLSQKNEVPEDTTES